jgi:HEAT repeat protein
MFLAALLSGISAGEPPSTFLLRSPLILDEGLRNPNPARRREAVLALSIIGPREPFLSELESMLGDKDVQVRVATVASLADLGTERTTALLRRTLRDRTPEVSFAAAKALWRLKDPAGRAALIEVVTGESKTSSGYFTKEMRETLRMLHEPRAALLFAFQEGLGFVPVPGVGAGVASLEGLLSDDGVSGRATATLLLGTRIDQESFRTLRAALKDQDWSVRAAAVHSLALLNRPSLQPDFVPLLEDDHGAVRYRAAAACLRLEAIRKSAGQR